MNFIRRLTQRILIGDEEAQERHREQKRMDELITRRGGTRLTKVYKCGVCGNASLSGQYVVIEGMALCPKHAQMIEHATLGIDIYECPSCGYKFLQGWNEDFYKRERCSNCGRHLDDNTWKIPENR